jgi:hypothetical protein
MNADAFDDLEGLRLPPELLAQIKPKPEGKTFQRRKRLTGNFYMAPETWLEDAYEAVGSKEQFLVALRLYRLWRCRKPRTDYVVASNAKLGVLHDVKRRALENLWAAKLIEVVSGGNGRAPRVVVLD